MYVVEALGRKAPSVFGRERRCTQMVYLSSARVWSECWQTKKTCTRVFTAKEVAKYVQKVSSDERIAAVPPYEQERIQSTCML